jgi:glutamate formiminotransferase/formiminotetrahydrofolate cyclodeaminase
MDQAVRFGDLTVATFVDRLASASPVPGGGSAAAIAGSLAASLVVMVASLSGGRPKYAEHAALHADALTAGRALGSRFLTLADEDAAAFERFGEAMRLPRDSDAQRESRSVAIRHAARGAAEVPYRTIEACIETVRLSEALAGRSNRNAASDLEVSALLAVAAAEAAAANVRINLQAIGDDDDTRDLARRTDDLLDEIQQLAARTRTSVASGEAREPLESARR